MCYDVPHDRATLEYQLPSDCFMCRRPDRELHVLKANMNSYILLQMAAIFFLSSFYLKQGIDSVYVMVGFICKG